MIAKAAMLLLLSFYLAIGCIIFPHSTWLLLNAQSLTGKAIAIAGLNATLLPLTAFLHYSQRKPRALWLWASLLLALTTFTLSATIILTAPTGHPPPGSPVSHRFTTSTTFNRYALTNIIPEMEQINLGFWLMPFLDPFLTHAQARRVSVDAIRLYREMDRDANFHQLGSAMGLAYADLLGQPLNVGHYYLYVPNNRDAGPLPAIIFLHGSAGNFKAYLWQWSQLAEEKGIVIIAPSGGFGSWQRQGAIEAIMRALEDAATAVDIDPSQIYLAGLSNGGLGVSRLAAAHPDAFCGLIFISPVMDGQALGSNAFLESWQGRPVLVVSGMADRRVPIDYIQGYVAQLRSAGVAVSDIGYEGVDHFLFFSQGESVLADTSSWLSDGERCR